METCCLCCKTNSNFRQEQNKGVFKRSISNEVKESGHQCVSLVHKEIPTQYLTFFFAGDCERIQTVYSYMEYAQIPCTQFVLSQNLSTEEVWKRTFSEEISKMICRQYCE